MTNRNFHDIIRLRREELLMTQKELADAIGVDAPMYSRIERGSRPIKEEAISILADVLDLNARVLRKLWLADKVLSVVNNEDDAADILSLAAKNITDRNISTLWP